MTLDDFVGGHETVQQRIDVIVHRRARAAVPIPGVSH
jgi:hypothetical protein